MNVVNIENMAKIEKYLKIRDMKERYGKVVERREEFIAPVGFNRLFAGVISYLAIDRTAFLGILYIESEYYLDILYLLNDVIGLFG